ncbi:UDP-2,4-diacetamido-2,4,6-trideoxy-beta-L-altropyranose hydrolase [Gammaproteobacteria bacterium]|nr:UDP-2,4-diacetamido-2,4,6-trideoxy-beta-L-altropyranose hydrolase [Gammaproteobacteria bacterium]
MIRVEVNSKVGWGHGMRCLALAQGLRSMDHHPVFVGSLFPSYFKKKLEQESISIHELGLTPGTVSDSRATIIFGRQCHADWVIVDGYVFNSAYQRSLKQSSMNLLWIDDFGHAAPYCSDIILNQNISANASLYEQRSQPSTLLLGSTYALLRKEFSSTKAVVPKPPHRVTTLLISMGGIDSERVAQKILKGIDLITLNTFELIIIVGMNPDLEADLKRLAGLSPHKVTLLTNVEDMSRLIQWADLAITGGGSTVWEVASLGVPNAVVVLADNQRPAVEYLSNLGAILNLGWHDALTPQNVEEKVGKLSANPTRREEMSRLSKSLVDANGVLKVVQQMELLNHAKPYLEE